MACGCNKPNPADKWTVEFQNGRKMHFHTEEAADSYLAAIGPQPVPPTKLAPQTVV